MSDHLFQVTYIGPVSYDENEAADREQLDQAVEMLMKEYAARRLGVAGVQVGYVLGMFLVFTVSAETASWLPLNFQGFERGRESIEVDANRLLSARNAVLTPLASAA